MQAWNADLFQASKFSLVTQYLKVCRPRVGRSGPSDNCRSTLIWVFSLKLSSFLASSQL